MAGTLSRVERSRADHWGILARGDIVVWYKKYSRSADARSCAAEREMEVWYRILRSSCLSSFVVSCRVVSRAEKLQSAGNQKSGGAGRVPIIGVLQSSRERERKE